jgi:transposase InsO family protein
MKWPEEIVLKEANTEHLIQFLQENSLTSFGVLKKFIIDNGPIFTSSKFTSFCGKNGIVMGQSSNYYPQGNGLVESTNKSMVYIFKKIVVTNRRD